MNLFKFERGAPALHACRCGCAEFEPAPLVRQGHRIDGLWEARCVECNRFAGWSSESTIHGAYVHVAVSIGVFVDGFARSRVEFRDAV